MKQTILIIISLFLASITWGQDQFVLHRDKPFYVSGEVVWYSVKLPASLEGKQITINNYIANSTGAIKKQFFSKNGDSNMIEGYFAIPYDWTSDMYQLALFAKSATDLTETLLAKFEIPIYNDLKPAKLEMVDVSTGTNPDLPSVILTLSHNALAPRQQLTISNQSITGWSDLSVTVVDDQLYGGHLHELVDIYDSAVDMTSREWMNQPYLTGKIRSANEAVRVNVLGAYDTKGQSMLYSKSNGNGEFQIAIDEYTGPKALHVNGYLFNEFDDIEVMVPSSIGVSSSNQLTIDSTVLNYLEVSRQRKKIYQQFGKIESELTSTQTKQKVNELKPNRIYRIKDYQSFDNIAAFFNEILSSELSFVIEDNNTYSARMYNPRNNRNANRKESSYFDISPIFIIDGKVTKDADRIGRLPLDNIITVGLYYKQEDIKRDFGTFGGSPYVVITTSYPDYQLASKEEADIIDLYGLQAQADYPQLQNMIDADEPVFRTMLYWNPDITTDRPVAITQSDDISQYKVVLVGRDNSGAVRMAQGEYRSGLEK